MVISKSVANDIAKILCQKHYKFYENVYSDFLRKTQELYEALIPEKVMEFFKEFPDFTSAVNGVYLYGNGWRTSLYVPFSRRIPSIKDNETFCKKHGAELRKMYDKAQTLLENYKSLVTEVESTLLGLKTYKAIEATFPEAKRYLPVKNKNMALIVNVDSTRSKLNSVK